MLKKLTQWLSRIFNNAAEQERRVQIEKQLYAMNFIDELKRRAEQDAQQKM